MISKKKKVFAKIKRLFLAEIRNLRVFSSQKQVISKKQVFAEIHWLFLAGITNLRGFSDQNQVDFKKKKRTRRKSRAFSAEIKHFSSASLFPRNLVQHSTGLCMSFSSLQPALKSRWGTPKSRWGDAQSRWGDASPPRPSYNLSTGWNCVIKLWQIMHVEETYATWHFSIILISLRVEVAQISDLLVHAEILPLWRAFFYLNSSHSTLARKT